MEANLLSRVGTSNGCTVGSSVHGVIVVGDLLRGHFFTGMRQGKRKVLYSTSMIGSWSCGARLAILQ
jgi:hypothetical protein